MAVFRVERTSDYTVMSNYHLRDKRLSLKAKGLLSQMLSLPEEWDYTLAGLCYINRESKDAIRTAIRELEQAATYAAAKPSTAAASSQAMSTRSMNGHRNRHRTNRHRKNRRREIRQRENRCRKNRHNKI